MSRRPGGGRQGCRGEGQVGIDGQRGEVENWADQGGGVGGGEDGDAGARQASWSPES